MKKILQKCDLNDLQFISETLDSYFAPVDDQKRKDLLKKLANNPDDKWTKNELISLMDKQIRYFGSSDVAYLFRSFWNNDGGVSAHELVTDVCDKLKVKIKAGSSTEACLEKLVYAVAEKELTKKSSEELANEFRKNGIGESTIQEIIFEFSKKSSTKNALLPIIKELCGMEVMGGIAQSIIINVLATIMGKEAAKQLLTQLARRNPWINALGPIVWTVSTAWLAYDIQGPALRKTVPICLYLGVVALRDGTEEQLDNLLLL